MHAMGKLLNKVHVELRRQNASWTGSDNILKYEKVKLRFRKKICKNAITAGRVITQ